MSVTEQIVGDLLDEQSWTGRIFSDGWVDAPDTIESVEPATGDVLGTAGVANAATVAAAAKSATRAQREWAALPMTLSFTDENAPVSFCVLRRMTFLGLTPSAKALTSSLRLARVRSMSARIRSGSVLIRSPLRAPSGR